MSYTEEFLLEGEDVPQALRDWLAARELPTVVTTLELLSDGRLVVRPLPGVSAELIAQLRVTMARYNEAMMNLS